MVNVWVASLCFKLQVKFATRAKSASSLQLMSASSPADVTGISPPFQHWSVLPVYLTGSKDVLSSPQ